MCILELWSQFLTCPSVSTPANIPLSVRTRVGPSTCLCPSFPVTPRSYITCPHPYSTERNTSWPLHPEVTDTSLPLSSIGPSWVPPSPYFCSSVLSLPPPKSALQAGTHLPGDSLGQTNCEVLYEGAKAWAWPKRDVRGTIPKSLPSVCPQGLLLPLPMSLSCLSSSQLSPVLTVEALPVHLCFPFPTRFLMPLLTPIFHSRHTELFSVPPKMLTVAIF